MYCLEVILCLAFTHVRALPNIESDKPAFIDVFVRGAGGFSEIRIPSVVVSAKGTLVAFAEGRANGKSDQASNKILLRRSLDGGRTWDALRVLEDSGQDSLNNPCAVVERKTGKIFLMYQRLPAGLQESNPKIPTGFDGPNLCSCLLTSSGDDGLSWTKPKDITRSAKRAELATTICSGPGIGIQLTRGKHKNRLIMPFNEGPFYRWNNYAVYSDDLGKTWKCGENAPGARVSGTKGELRSQVNEVQMAELSDGSVRLNSRQFAGAKLRKSAVSPDGGQTWSSISDIPELRDPSCMASFFRYGFGGRRNVLLYSGPDSTDRAKGTVHVSSDDGNTWSPGKVLWPGAFAYSVLCRLPDGQVGCLFEADDYRRIVFARFPLKWLSESDHGT